MSVIKSVYFSLFLFSAATYAQFTDVINSNRPGESQAAFSVGKTVIQAELGVYGYKEEHSKTNYEATGFGSDIAIRYGAFFEQLEFILEAQYQTESYSDLRTFQDRTNSSFKNATIGSKFLLYDPMKKYVSKPNIYSWKANHKFNYRQLIPAVGVYAGFNFDLDKGKFDRPTYPSENSVSPKLGILTQNQLGRYVLVMNVMADKVASPRETIDYVVTLTRGFNERWSGFIEHQGYVSDFYADAIFRGGAAFLIKQNIQVDASVGTNIKDTPSLLLGAIGVSWRFDANYEDVYIRLPGEDKGDKKDKKKKEKKEKDKKRLDEVEGEKN